MSTKTFIIIYDTYCAWCYGAAPVFDAIIASGSEVKLLHRQLFTGTNGHRMGYGFGQQASRIDAHIGELTGQPFGQAYIDNILCSDSEVLSSELTAQAAALIRHKGAVAELSLATRLQKLRFVDGVSAKDENLIVDALITEGISKDDAKQINTPPLRARALDTAKEAAALLSQYGGKGVPTVLNHINDSTKIVDVSQYYGKPEAMRQLAVCAGVKARTFAGKQ